MVRPPDSWSKGLGFESQQEQQENFLLCVELSVLTLISVSVPPLWIVQGLECQTHDQKVSGSSPIRSGRRNFFSRFNCLCRLLLQYLFHPCVTAVARKRSWSFACCWPRFDPAGSTKNSFLWFQLLMHRPPPPPPQWMLAIWVKQIFPRLYHASCQL